MLIKSNSELLPSAFPSDIGELRGLSSANAGHLVRYFQYHSYQTAAAGLAVRNGRAPLLYMKITESKHGSLL